MHLVKNLIGNCWAALFPPLLGCNNMFFFHVCSPPHLCLTCIAAPPIDLQRLIPFTIKIIITINNNETFLRSTALQCTPLFCCLGSTGGCVGQRSVFIVRFESCSSPLRDCGGLPSLGMKFKSPREFLWTESWAEHSLHKRNQKRDVETRWLGISKWIINFSWIYDPARERPNDLARPHFNRKCWSGFCPESSGIMGIMIREGGGVGGEDKLTVL